VRSGLAGRQLSVAINRISAGALYQLALTLDVPVQYFLMA
jgi:hypothetical protein